VPATLDVLINAEIAPFGCADCNDLDDTYTVDYVRCEIHDEFSPTQTWCYWRYGFGSTICEADYLIIRLAYTPGTPDKVRLYFGFNTDGSSAFEQKITAGYKEWTASEVDCTAWSSQALDTAATAGTRCLMTDPPEVTSP